MKGRWILMDYDYSQAVASSTSSNVASIMSSVLMIAGFWFLFVKANEDGWKRNSVMITAPLRARAFPRSQTPCRIPSSRIIAGKSK